MAPSGCRQQKPTLPFRIRLAVDAGVGGEGWAGGELCFKGKVPRKVFWDGCLGWTAQRIWGFGLEVADQHLTSKDLS